jgi:hypothetical protein
MPKSGCKILGFSLVVIGLSSAPVAADSLWDATTIPAEQNASDASSVELGVKFKSSVAGTVSAIRFYKGSQNTGAHSVSLWKSNGTKLATANSTNETASGWQTVALSPPVSITANTTYIASYHTAGHYSDDQYYFSTQYVNGSLTAPANAGVYKYSTISVFPNLVWNASNYWVDVVVASSGGTVVNGSCGSSNGGSFYTAPTTNLCSAGTASSVTGAGPWNWSCAGSGGGTTAQCSALLKVDGACGPANGVATSTAPTTGLCSAGTASAVTGSGPWAWSCAGSNGGTTASCSAPLQSSGGGGGAADGIPAGWPNSTNTGYRNAPGYPGSLHACSGPIQSNTTYSFCDFSGGLFVGSSSAPVSNVTFYGSRFRATGDLNVALFGDHITFDYSSFEPLAVSAPPVSYTQGYQYGISADGSYASHVSALTVTHSDIWGFGNAIDHAGSTQAKPHVFEHNWIHDARADGGGIDHTDGIGELSGGTNNSYVTINHNTIVSVGNTQGIAYQGKGVYDRFTVTNNYLSGFGYTVALGNSGGTASNTMFTGNVFGTNFKPDWGPLYSWSDNTNNVWKCNWFHVVPGSYYTVTADDGKFWIPGYNYVSATDYKGNTTCPARPF